MSFNYSFKLHGNYCGPGYSQGQFKEFDYNTRNPIDEFDETCYYHDRKYAKRGYKIGADYKFFKQNIGKGFLRSVAGIGVLLNPFKYSYGVGAAGTRRNAKGDGPKRKASKKNKAGKPRKPRMRQRMQPRANALVTVPSAFGMIRHNTQNLVVKFSHSELLYDQIPGSVNWVTHQYTINAGLASTFSWLSVMGLMWKQYHFTDINFRFVPSQSSNVTGNVYMAFDYDSLDIAPGDKADFMNYEDNASSNSWLPLGMKLNPRSLDNIPWLYVRSGGVQSTKSYDLKTYDVGNLYLATQGQAATTPIGDVFVDYSVVLTKPCPNPGALETDTGPLANLTGMTHTLPFGSNVSTLNALEQSNNPIGVWTASTGGAPAYLIQRSGYYTMVWDIQGTGITTVAGDVTLAFTSYGDVLNNEISTTALGNLSGVYIYYMSVTEGQEILFSIGTATTITGSHLRIFASQYIN